MRPGQRVAACGASAPRGGSGAGAGGTVFTRRGFLRFLSLAPIVGPLAIKALGAEPWSITTAPMPLCCTPFLKNLRGIWVYMPGEIYLTMTLKDDCGDAIRGDTITFTKIKPLSAPPTP